MSGTILKMDVTSHPWPIDTASVQLILTSPPYWNLRDYHVAEQLGAEPTPEAYAEHLVAAVSSECKRILRPSGVFALNLGDMYLGSGGAEGTKTGAESLNRRTDAVRLSMPVKSLSRRAIDRTTWRKPKQLCLLPWRVALRLQDDGWILRSHVVWAKRIMLPDRTTIGSCKPLSQRSRWVSAWEPVFFFQKPGAKDAYRWDGVSTRSGSNPPDVWQFRPAGYKGVHFAAYPIAFAERIITAYTHAGDTVADIFAGSGATGIAAQNCVCAYILCDINDDYIRIMKERGL